MGLKILYGLVVLGSPLHMRDPNGRHDAEENSTLLQISFSFSLSSNRRGYVMLFSIYKSLAKGMESTWFVEVWRCEGG